jgi:hypothetical protein
MANLHEDQCTIMIISRPILRRRNISDKSCRENQNTHFTFSIFFFFEKFTIYEEIRKNFVEADRPQMTKWTLRNACLIPKATNTQSDL